MAMANTQGTDQSRPKNDPFMSPQRPPSTDFDAFYIAAWGRLRMNWAEDEARTADRTDE